MSILRVELPTGILGLVTLSVRGELVWHFSTVDEEEVEEEDDEDDEDYLPLFLVPRVTAEIVLWSDQMVLEYMKIVTQVPLLYGV